MAPIPADVYRIVFEGDVASGQDFWNVVIHMQGGAFDTAAYHQALCDLAFTEWAATMFGSTGAGYFAQTCNLRKTSLYLLDTDNHATGVYEHVGSGTLPSGSDNVALPPEVSACLSLDTDRPGRSYRGRSYMPQLGVAALQAGGWFSDTCCEVLSAQYAELLSTLNTYTLDGAGPAQAGVLSVTKGSINSIFTVRCGNVADVQRRRRNSITEGYFATDVIPPSA